MNVDCPDDYRSVDKTGMIDRILSCPEQLGRSEQLVSRLDLRPGEYDSIENILVTGMGGSGIPGDFLSVVLGPALPVPLLVNKDYCLPKFVGPRTLVLAISYSGTTEETMVAFRRARAAGAKIIAITSGAKLGELCEKYRIPAVLIPSGSQSRASFGYMLFSSLLLFERLGLSPSMQKSRRETAVIAEGIREELHPNVSTADNLAKQIANSLAGSFPIMYGTRDGSEVVALRWRQLINENSKMLAHHEALPEVNHNEIAVWEVPQAVEKKIRMIFLRDHCETGEMRDRIELTRGVFERRGQEIIEVWCKGESLLARLFSQSYVGDFVSYYLAMLGDVDPTPIESIAFLRSELSKRRPRD